MGIFGFVVGFEIRYSEEIGDVLGLLEWTLLRQALRPS